MRPLLLLGLAGCNALTPIGPEDFCHEAGYAIARRTEQCTSDIDLANARYLAFERQYDCIPIQMKDPPEGVAPEDLYACPLTIERLPCDIVEELGDDIDAWLASAAACSYLVE
jgi:hypothetical protein